MGEPAPTPSVALSPDVSLWGHRRAGDWMAGGDFGMVGGHRGVALHISCLAFLLCTT